MNPFDLNLFWWTPLVRLLTDGLRLFATPLEGSFPPGVAGGLAIILFTLAIRLLLLPLSLQQVKSQKAQMAIQPEMKVIQKRYKGDREGLAKAQMQLYKERGVNPAAGCLPMLVQMPILFGMYSALTVLASQGLSLPAATQKTIEPGRVVYAAEKTEHPLPSNQFTLFSFEVTPRSNAPIELAFAPEGTALAYVGQPLLAGTQNLTLTPGQSTSTPNTPNTPGGKASLFLRPGGTRNADGTLDRNVQVQVGRPYVVEAEIQASGTRVDRAQALLTFDPALADAANIETPVLQDVAFKSAFLWLPSLGEPDVLGTVFGIGIPGFLLILMTITSFLSQRMTVVVSDDPQQQAMMKSMAFMPLMYLFFFLQTPAGLVLYWFVSNLFQMIQQYFTTGLGTLAGDLKRFTNRDLQPPWAHVPGVVDTSSSTTHASANGTGAEDTDMTKPARGGRTNGAVANVRIARPSAGKGRKRGKR